MKETNNPLFKENEQYNPTAIKLFCFLSAPPYMRDVLFKYIQEDRTTFNQEDFENDAVENYRRQFPQDTTEKSFLIRNTREFTYQVLSRIGAAQPIVAKGTYQYYKNRSIYTLDADVAAFIKSFGQHFVDSFPNSDFSFARPRAIAGAQYPALSIPSLLFLHIADKLGGHDLSSPDIHTISLQALGIEEWRELQKEKYIKHLTGSGFLKEAPGEKDFKTRALEVSVLFSVPYKSTTST